MKQNNPLAEPEEISLSELVTLAAVDSDLYAQHFFPKTARQKAPDFHREMDAVLENPVNRFVGFEVFRGGAKTSKLRLWCSKRIAYGISHTILFVGKSQDHAIKSVEWLMRQVEFNTPWAQAFGLRKGKRWTSSDIEIIHATEEYPIRVLALGITGSVRGINIDDYRPDLIILDDIQDEENAATLEQRQKIDDLVFGALAKSLAPTSEAPDATMALAQTPLVRGDTIDKIMEDTQWVSVRFSCFTEKGESAWPARWTTEELLADKAAHIQRNQLSLWLREMECVLVTRENAAFKEEWLQYWEVLPEGGIHYIGIDPTPPPKEGANALKVVNMKLDDAVVLAIKFYKGKVYLCDYYTAKSPDPDELINEIFTKVAIWKPLQTGVETTMFQRMLKHEIEKEKIRRREYFTLIPVEDKRAKHTRIVQAVSRYASSGALVVNKALHAAFIEQYVGYQSGVANQRDDILDALTIALDLINPYMEGVTLEGDFEEVIDESGIPELEEWRAVP